MMKQKVRKIEIVVHRSMMTSTHWAAFQKGDILDAGGFGGPSHVGDFHAFDFFTMTWREITSTRPPWAQHPHSAVYICFIAFRYDGFIKKFIYKLLL
jgi:hypothetical protein